MKRFYLLFFVFFLFALSANAQTTVLSEDGKKLKELDKKIEAVEIEKKSFIQKRSDLLARYSEDYVEVRAIDLQLPKFDEVLLGLQSERKILLTKKLTTELPDNNITLLKMIVVQNERIIELLEKLSKPE